MLLLSHPLWRLCLGVHARWLWCHWCVVSFWNKSESATLFFVTTDILLYVSLYSMRLLFCICGYQCLCLSGCLFVCVSVLIFLWVFFVCSCLWLCLRVWVSLWWCMCMSGSVLVMIHIWDPSLPKSDKLSFNQYGSKTDQVAQSWLFKALSFRVTHYG